jgi:hypothetical protein
VHRREQGRDDPLLGSSAPVSATCAIVTSSKPRSANIAVAMSEMASRVCCLRRPRGRQPRGRQKLNLLAVLMLAVNLVGIVVSFLTGDPRAVIAKDSIVSSVIAFVILGSVIAPRRSCPRA